jgi:hypothetical protein
MTFRRNFERCSKDRTYLNMRLSPELRLHFGVPSMGASVPENGGAARPVTGMSDGTGSQHE